MKVVVVILLLIVLFAAASTFVGWQGAAWLCVIIVVIGALVRLGGYEIPMPAQTPCSCCECKEKR